MERETLTIERIKNDMLSKKIFFKKTKEKIYNGKFKIIKDVFEIQGRSFLTGIRCADVSKVMIPVMDKHMYYSTRVYKYYELYLVILDGDTLPFIMYDTNFYHIPDELIAQKAEMPSLMYEPHQNTITSEFLHKYISYSETSKEIKPTKYKMFNTARNKILKLSEDDTPPISIFPMICIGKKEGGDAESGYDYYAVFSDGKRTIDIKKRFVDNNGNVKRDDDSAYDMCRINELYYIVYHHKYPELIFPAKYWSVSEKLYSIPALIHKPTERTEYIKELDVFISNGLAEEIYGDDTMSIVNYANYCYGISDYQKHDEHFVFVAVGFDVVQLLLNKPETLPLIMSCYHRKTMANENIISISELCDKTCIDNVSKFINKNIEAEIKQLRKL